jgi:hypothetical protein
MSNVILRATIALNIRPASICVAVLAFLLATFEILVCIRLYMTSSSADAASFSWYYSFPVWNVAFAKTTAVFKSTSAANHILK